MKILIKKISIMACICIQLCFSMQPAVDIYNYPRLIFHAIGPKFSLPGLEGIDPSFSITAMEMSLQDVMEKSPDLSGQIKDRIVKARMSLARAKTNYLTCIGLVKLAEEPRSVGEMALKLSEDAKSLQKNEFDPSILFIGGHYLYSKEGSLGGHTATFDVARQEDGKLCYTVINTIKTENHVTDGSFIHELIYTDLEATDLDEDLWKNVIKLNYMNPNKGAYLMEAFYKYLDKKLNKGSNKTVGRAFHRQEKWVCAWKSISVWLHGKIAPGKRSSDRIACNELAYLHYKKCMFERMAARFKPNSSLALQTGVTLKTELEKKIQKNKEDCKLLIPNDV